MPNRRILLCGCGWLGKQLIAPLMQQSYELSATTRSSENIIPWQQKGILCSTFHLGDDFPQKILSKDQPTTAVLMLPPGRRNPNTELWEANIQKLIEGFKGTSIDHIIFISTTSVYDQVSIETVTENSATLPSTASGRSHVAIEEYLSKNKDKLPYTIIRLAGLVGPDRHPARNLSGRHLTDPNKRVNLVHSADVVRAILQLLVIGPQNRPLHLCCNSHPQRKAYYEWCARQLGIPIPMFEPNTDTLTDTGKLIDARASWSVLGVKPRYCSPYDMLPKD